VLSVSGDGTVNEIYTGLISRPDSAKAVLMPVGIVPAGSEGTLAKMATYFNPFAAAYVILKSHEVRPLDVLKVAQGAEICFALCGVGWGIPGKVAEESEQLRSTYGRSRYAVSAIKEFVAFKGCSGLCSTLVLQRVVFFFRPLFSALPVSGCAAVPSLASCAPLFLCDFVFGDACSVARVQLLNQLNSLSHSLHSLARTHVRSLAFSQASSRCCRQRSGRCALVGPGACGVAQALILQNVTS
jgi:hypothetical protein